MKIQYKLNRLVSNQTMVPKLQFNDYLIFKFSTTEIPKSRLELKTDKRSTS